MFVSSPKCNNEIQAFLPSVAEVGLSILFLIVWLFPIIACWLVAFSGLRFSYAAQNWQMSNIDIVGYSIVLSFLSGLLAAIMVLIMLARVLNVYQFRDIGSRLCGIQWVFILVVASLSGIGVFKSFGGTVFDKAYSGATTAWWGYGAWSVTYEIALCILVGEMLSRRLVLSAAVCFVTLAYLPILLCGSRIDYFSLMLALSAYIFYLSTDRFRLRFFKSSAIVTISILVCFFVGNIRYQNFKVPESLSQATLGVGLKSNQRINSGNQSITDLNYSSGVIKPDMFYLSTVGDVGASFFQIVGLVENGDSIMVGAPNAINNYLERLLPGPFFKDRPGDLSGVLPESVAGGTLHPLGEAYLIAGYIGCSVVSAILGAIVAASVFCARHLKYSWSPTAFVLFLFPWLLLIRGGWYQFFSIFKSLEIIFIFTAGLVIIEFLKKHCWGKNLWRRMC